MGVRESIFICITGVKWPGEVVEKVVILCTYIFHQTSRLVYCKQDIAP